MYSLIMMTPYLLMIVGMVYYHKRTKNTGYNKVYKVYYGLGRNIYTLGIGRDAKIIVGVELLNILNREELSALIYHERGHIAKSHILKNLIYLFIISAGATFLTYKAEGVFGYLTVLLFIISSFTLFFINSRFQEYIADTYSSKFIEGYYLLSALIKLDNSRYSFTHPNYRNRAINLGQDEV